MPRKTKRISYLNEVVVDGLCGRRSVRISDISYGGCYIDTISTFIAGEPVTVTVKGPEGQSETFEGEVAYVLEGDGFGVRFNELCSPKREFLRTLIEPRINRADQ
jgi:hypothetical protein